MVRELESPEQVPEEQLGAALAYLEVLWVDARRRAAETDAALEALGADGRCHSPVVSERARRYNAAVRRLRASSEARVTAHHPPRLAPLAHASAPVSEPIA